MPDAPPPHGSRGWPADPSAGGDLGGPATAVRAGGGAAAAPPTQSRPAPGRDAAPRSAPVPPLQYRSPVPDTRRGGRLPGRDRDDLPGRDDLAARDARAMHDPRAADLAAAPVELEERGLPGWAGLLLLLVVAGIGGLIDSVSGAQVRGGFNIGIIVASIVAILAVKRSAMFPIVVAPPLVYAGASGAMLYLRSGGLNDRKVLFDAAANWLVYGFPAIAAATAAVLIIAGIRMVVRR